MERERIAAVLAVASLAWLCADGCTGKVGGPEAPETSGAGGIGASASAAGSGGMPGCTPHCLGRSCGDDGCNGSCGTCAADETCGEAGKCLAQCPCFLGECASCYCAATAQQYAAKNGCANAAVPGNDGALLGCAGAKDKPGKWSVGTKCDGGCVSAPPPLADYCAPKPGVHSLWIAFDAATSGPRDRTREFFDCVLQHSNFDQLTTAFASGRSLAGVASVAVLPKPCATVHAWWCANVGDDAATLKCIEDQTQWPLAADDVVLYFPVNAEEKAAACNDSWDGSGCQDGRNAWHIPVTLPDQKSVSVEMAFGFTAASENCQTALALHEVYEASAADNAGDCCNHQGSCKQTAPNPPFGWYYHDACGKPGWALQYLSPAGQLWNPAACTELTFK